MDRALDRAIDVFRARGYHATSIGDLRKALDLTAGSIYKAFQSKRAVFLAALERYSALRDAEVARVVATCRTGRERLRAMVLCYAGRSAGRDGRLGCLVVGTAVEVAALDAEIAGKVRGRLKRLEAAICELIAQGKADGSLRTTVDSAAAARAILCALQGMRVVGKLDPDPDRMQATAELVLRLVE